MSETKMSGVWYVLLNQPENVDLGDANILILVTMATVVQQ